VSSTEISRSPAWRPADPIREAPAPRSEPLVETDAAPGLPPAPVTPPATLVPWSRLDARVADRIHDREFQL
jgi:hypothetical protein